MRNIAYTTAAAMALALACAGPVALAEDKAPMPQTKGMQGMDPKLHDQQAKDPHEGCVPNKDKSAQQAQHPMPDTKGMKGMDPKAHTVDCPEGYVPQVKPAHVHKAPGG